MKMEAYNMNTDSKNINLVNGNTIDLENGNILKPQTYKEMIPELDYKAIKIALEEFYIDHMGTEYTLKNEKEKEDLIERGIYNIVDTPWTYFYILKNNQREKGIEAGYSYLFGYEFFKKENKKKEEVEFKYEINKEKIDKIIDEIEAEIKDKIRQQKSIEQSISNTNDILKFIKTLKKELKNN